MPSSMNSATWSALQAPGGLSLSGLAPPMPVKVKPGTSRCALICGASVLRANASCSVRAFTPDLATL